MANAEGDSAGPEARLELASAARKNSWLLDRDATPSDIFWHHIHGVVELFGATEDDIGVAAAYDQAAVAAEDLGWVDADFESAEATFVHHAPLALTHYQAANNDLSIGNARRLVKEARDKEGWDV